MAIIHVVFVINASDLNRKELHLYVELFSQRFQEFKTHNYTIGRDVNNALQNLIESIKLKKKKKKKKYPLIHQ